MNILSGIIMIILAIVSALLIIKGRLVSSNNAKYNIYYGISLSYMVLIGVINQITLELYFITTIAIVLSMIIGFWILLQNIRRK